MSDPENDGRPTIEEFKAALALIGMKIGLRHFEFLATTGADFARYTPVEFARFDELDFHHHPAVCSVFRAYNVPWRHYSVRTHGDNRGIMVSTADLQRLFVGGDT